MFINIWENIILDFQIEIFLFFSVNLLLLVCMFTPNKYLTLIIINIFWFIQIICILILSLIIIIYINYIDNITFITYIKIFVLFIYLCILSLLKNKIWLFYKYEFFILLNINLFGLFILISSKNFITFILSLEIYTYASYILISYRTNSLLSTEGGIKYLIINSISSGLIFLGICIIYFSTGSVIFSEISDYLLINNILNYYIWFGLILIFISIFIKIGLAPFHLWYLDAYEDIDFWVLAFLGIIPKICLIGIIVQLYCYLHLYNFWLLKDILYFCGILSVISSNITILLQLNIMRLLLYYAIQGNAFIAFLFSIGYIDNFQSLFIYLFFYSLVYLNILLLFHIFIKWHNNNRIRSIYELYNLFLINPILSWNLMLVIFNLISLPPFIFFGIKILLLLTLLKTSFYFILFLLILNCFTIFVYLRILHLIFFYEDYLNINFFYPISYLSSLCISCLTLIQFLIFFFIQPIMLLFI